MHPALFRIKTQLEETLGLMDANIQTDEPIGLYHGGSIFPCLTKSELKEEIEEIIEAIEKYGSDELGSNSVRIEDYMRRVDHLRHQVVPQIINNPGQAVPAFIFTLHGLKKAITTALDRDDDAEELARENLKKLAIQIRSMEARLKGLEPRTASMQAMIEKIESAHNAALNLPTDMESLAEARVEIENFVHEATVDHAYISKIKKESEVIDEKLKECIRSAELVLERCETAYSAATSVGLAAAFSERSKTLSESMWVWVFGLIFALALGSIYGSSQLHSLSEAFKTPNVKDSVVVLNLILSIVSLGAPIWFAWLATKQIGQRFKLAEDYAFKASVSRAYEGFRREAARFDKDMESKLLNSALTRLDELPLRLVETESHGSPWHELASSSAIKSAMQTVPGFAEQVRVLASSALASTLQTKEPTSKKTRQESDEVGE